MKVLGYFLYGSQNYHLDLPTSDYDYKVIVTPSFDELYYNENLRKKHAPGFPASEHYVTMDIRDWEYQLRRGNPNAVELLYSTHSGSYGDTKFTQFCMAAEASLAQGHLQQVWPDFIAAIKGMIKDCLRKNDPKGTARAYWFYNFAAAIQENDYCLTRDLFHSPFIWGEPRKMRLEGRMDFDADLINTIPMPEQTDVGLFWSLSSITKDIVRENL